MPYAGVIGRVVRRLAVLRIARISIRRAVQHVVKGRVAAPRDLTKGHPVELRPVRISPACLRRRMAVTKPLRNR